jgi:peroxiredoxin
MIKMKRAIQIVSVAIVLLVISTAFKLAVSPELEIGKPIPSADVKMMDVKGTEVSLSEAKGENGLLVMFSCNTCPYVKLSEARILEVAKLAKENKIGVILVNSNEAQRADEDSFDAMKKYAKGQGYDFSYVLDKNSVVADAFGATRTPHCFLFDKKGLVYRGAIDDNIKDANDAKEHFLKDAIASVGTGKPVKTNSSKSVGCSIKRVE